MRCCRTMLLGVGLLLLAAVARSAEPKELPLVAEDNFEKGAGRWQPTDANAWKILDTDHGKVYSQYRASKYSPPYRSPFNLSLLKDDPVGDFVLTVKVQSTARDYPHRDVCLAFGYQDPAHFYYVHLGRTADPHSCQIMVVDKAARTAITKKTAPGVPWTDGWHEVKIVRRVADGTIEVYFDDMKSPLLTAVDKRFARGLVGLGTFDDTSNWDDFQLRGVKADK